MAARLPCVRLPSRCSHLAYAAASSQRRPAARVAQQQLASAPLVPTVSPARSAARHAQQEPPVGLAPLPCTYMSLAVLLASPDPAFAARVCIDVPDFVTDPLHEPAVVFGLALLALLAFPKLIRSAINFVALPAIVAMLAWLGISYPQETANSIYAVLEFVKEHPAASSIGVVTAAGVLLGPDLLAGAAVAGVAVLLAAQVGLLQLPALPQLPRLPGQQLVSRQLGSAGKAIRARLEELDEANDDRRDGRRDGGRDNNQRDGTRRDEKQPDRKRESSGASRPQQQPVLLQQQLQLQQQSEQEPAPALASEAAERPLAGLASRLGAAGKGLAGRLQDALPEQDQVTAAAQGLGARLAGLSERAGQSQVAQGLTQRARGVLSNARQAVQQQQQQQQQGQVPPAQVEPARAAALLEPAAPPGS